MSRLDSMLRRLAAQRDGLNWAATEIGDAPGDVLELGLGNGRTYDHLREILPSRRILVIEREVQAHHSCIPPDADLLLGEAAAMLAVLVARGGTVVLAHYDLGFGVAQADVAEAARLSPLIARVMRPGGILVSGQPLVGFTPLPPPGTIGPERYFFYRYTG